MLINVLVYICAHRDTHTTDAEYADRNSPTTINYIYLKCNNIIILIFMQNQSIYNNVVIYFQNDNKVHDWQKKKEQKSKEDCLQKLKIIQ